MATVTYNGVTLPFCQIIDFHQRSVYDEVGRTDRIATEFDITVQCVLNTNYLSSIAPNLLTGPNSDRAGVTGPTGIMDYIRTLMLQPRKKLSVVFNGVNLIPSTGLPGSVDSMNGPIPQIFDPIQLNDATFICRFHIITTYFENTSLSINTPITGQVGSLSTKNESNAGNILYNRWSEAVDIEDNYTRRTREGKFMIRSDNIDGKTADEMRSQMAVLGVPDGFLREHSHYKISPDGLRLEYRIVDREVFVMPPSPAFKADADYTESTNRGGARRFAEVRIKLRGDKSTSQRKLIETAIKVATTKLDNRLKRGTKPKSAVIEQSGLRLKMYENEVEFSLRFSFSADTQRVKKNIGTPIAAFAGVDTTTPSQDPSYTPAYKDRGSTPLLLQAAAYYDPALRGTLLQGGSPLTENTLTGRDTRYQMSRGLLPGQAGAKKE